jgi:hypothetical protein
LPLVKSYTFIPKQGFKSHNHPSECDHKFAETEKRSASRPCICRPQKTKHNGKVSTNRPGGIKNSDYELSSA